VTAVPDDKRADLCKLLGYAEELLRITEKVITDLSKDALRVYHENQLFDLVGVELGPSRDDWLRFSRLRETAPPEPDTMFEGWLSGLGGATTPPRLTDKHLITVPIEIASDLEEAGLALEADVMPRRGRDADSFLVDVLLRTENMPEFVAAYQEYCNGPWLAWAEVERPRRQSIAIYNQLFEALQRMVASGDDTPIECLFGMGIARWQHPAGRIDVPIIEQMVELHLDEITGAIVVRPREQPPRVSLKAFEEREVDAASGTQRDAAALLSQLLADPDIAFSPFNKATYDRVLRLCQARLAGNAVYEADGTELRAGSRPLPHFDEILRINDSWVLYVRQRSADFRCDDIRRLKDEIRSAQSDDDLPRPAVQFATKPSSTRDARDDVDLGSDLVAPLPIEPAVPSGIDTRGGSGTGGGAPEVSHFFPLPYNDEQAEIIVRLEQKGTAGVVVQGPPGTGKTHTIANIICHYMAKGRRVLVTARTAEALTAIQSKMPEKIRPLTISVIHSDREGARQLEQAVDMLAREVATIDKVQLNNDRIDHERRLVQVRAESAAIDAQIRDYAAHQLQPVRFCGQAFLPMDLAALLKVEEAEHAWFADQIDLDPRYEPRFGKAELTEARQHRAQLGGDIIYKAEHLPIISDLPDTARLLAAHAALVREADAEARAARGDLPYVSLSDPNAPQLISETHTWLAVLGAWLDDVGAGGHSWVLMAYQILLDAESADAAARQALQALLTDWVRLQVQGRKLLLRGIETPAQPGDTVFDTAVGKLSRGEKPFGVFGGSALKAQLGQVRVAGSALAIKPAGDQTQWKEVQEWRMWQCNVVAFLGRWNAAARVLNLQLLPGDWKEGCDALLRFSSLVERMNSLYLEAPQRLTIIAGLFPHGVDAREVAVLGKLERVRDALAANLDRSSGQDARKMKAQLEAMAAAAPSLPFHAGMAAVAAMLGDPATAEHDLAGAWGEVKTEAVRLAGFTEARTRLDQITDLVASSGAPDWAARLRSERHEPRSEDAAVPVTWRRTWEWARTAGFIRRISDRDRIVQLSARRTELEAEQRRLLAEIVRLRTFIGLKQGITEKVSAALAKFVASVRRIGAGTGKSAERHRRASREAALDAAAAVPCWILPEWRIAEQLPSELGCFDLVIVDEASQSDITALPVVLRGRKLLVVGDDKQVSPSAVGIEERLAIQLRETYLRGMSIANFLDPATSLYELASMTFPGAVTMLREHFRCVEPIIRYSSRLYPKALVPLRLPTASERLDPPLIDVYVAHGRKVRDLNLAEAEWIVDEIERIAADPAMFRRTIGVISLVGDKQAKLIQDNLTKRLGTELMVRHRIVCGNAATFQGQERDIMFLSMVACPQTARVQTVRTIEQRFNVAMSRARDRLYLVRSVKASDLGPKDLKLAIIEHFANPMGETPVTQPTNVLDACGSDFEKEVGRRLLGLGYRVKPQVLVAGFRIDFVVEGSGEQRLAIELDGDKYHGPDRWADDVRRQRSLERMNWVFWRCWGSHWYADPEGCMQDLLATLQLRGVEPVYGDYTSVEWTRHLMVETANCEGASAVNEIASDQTSAADPESKASTAPAIAAGEATSEEPVDSIVAPGDTVVVRFADNSHTRKMTISPDRHAPESGIIGAS
jgi:very-short-patch-repair endonuclease